MTDSLLLVAVLRATVERQRATIQRVIDLRPICYEEDPRQCVVGYDELQTALDPEAFPPRPMVRER